MFRLPFLFDVTQKYFEKDSDNLSELGSLERDIEQKKVILLQKGADVNKQNSSSGTLENWKGIQFYCQGEIILKELQLELILNARKCENRRNIELMTPFYADLKRICETTNWGAGNCMQNEKLIRSFKNKNNQLKDENKYEESTTILIQRLVFCDTNTTTWGNNWKIAKHIQ